MDKSVFIFPAGHPNPQKTLFASSHHLLNWEPKWISFEVGTTVQYDRKNSGLGQFWAESRVPSVWVRVQVWVIDIRVQVLKNKDSSPSPDSSPTPLKYGYTKGYQEDGSLHLFIRRVILPHYHNLPFQHLKWKLLVPAWWNICKCKHLQFQFNFKGNYIFRSLAKENSLSLRFGKWNKYPAKVPSFARRSMNTSTESTQLYASLTQQNSSFNAS